MRQLDEQAVRDIGRGSAVLGTGGGGDPYLGIQVALRAFEEAGPPTLVSVEELDDDTLTACPLLFGAPIPLIEKFPLGPEIERAVARMGEVLDRPLEALMPVEAGGVNGVLPLAMSSRTGLPVIDADGMGRAYPSLELVTWTLYDMVSSPTVVADERGNTVVIDGVDAAWVDRLTRSTATEYGAICAACGFPMTAKQLRGTGILGSLTKAERIGAALREAAESKEDPVARVVEATGGFELFRGKIVDVVRRTERSWTFGEATIEGLGDEAGEEVVVKFQNENLVAHRKSGELLAVVPDLITMIDADTGNAITTERLRYGFRVVVLGIPCDPQWRTPDGVTLGGPSFFGYDDEYVPLEELAAKRLAVD